MLIFIEVIVGILCLFAVLKLWSKVKKARLAKMREEVMGRHREQQMIVIEELDKIADLIHNTTLSTTEIRQRINVALDVIKEQDSHHSYQEMIEDVLNYADEELSKRKV